MKLIHEIKLSVFSNEGEDSEILSNKLIELSHFDLEKEKLKLNTTKVKGVQDNEILIFDIILKKERHTNKFLDFLKKTLTADQKDVLIEQAESRLDDNLNFFVRFDKNKWSLENKLRLIDSGTCFHIRMHIAAYPAKRERGLEIVKNIFSHE